MAKAVEICVDDAESAKAAEVGGAHRVELCAEFEVGGVTPVLAEIDQVVHALSIPVHVLVRPRAGDFVYDFHEFDSMCQEVEQVKAAGAAGVVLGVLLPDGAVDTRRMASLIEHARPMSVTFHKAFDVTPNPFLALDTLIELGVERILTSGHSPTAADGLVPLAEFLLHARGRITIMAGGRVAIDDLAGLFRAGVDEIHVGSSVAPLGRTDANRVRSLVNAWTRMC
jgi:copper homeostasis protein